MLTLAFGVFVILHGLVHLLYVGQCARMFELQPGMTWPDNAWLFSRFLTPQMTRASAAALLAAAALAFVASGVGIVFRGSWWRVPVLIGASISTAIFLLFWDGGLQHLDNKGIFAILINAAILVLVFVIKWPGVAR